MPVYENVLDQIGEHAADRREQPLPEPGGAHPREAGEPEPLRLGQGPHRVASCSRRPEKEGSTQPGQTIIEPSSGNTGIALAAIARIKGYPIKILMPESVSIERRQMLEVFGAEIILTPGPEGSNGAVRRAQALAAEHPEWCFLYQYGNDANPRAHYEGTGPEIWRDCPKSRISWPGSALRAP